jgi:trimethylamine--corrinoid protein Co-methyltransferase
MNHILSSAKVLSDSEIELIHEKTLQLLEKTGFKVFHDEMLSICEKGGAKVDRISQTVRIPRELMESFLTRIRQKGYVNKGEHKPERMFGEISTQVYYIDLVKKIRRPGLIDDVLKGIVLTEKLINFEKADAVVVPSDVTEGMGELESMRLIYKYSSKPGSTYILTPFTAKYAIQMADIRGQKLSYLFETISPLQFRHETCELALLFAKNGHLLHTGQMVLAGGSGPITLAGSMVIENAEILAALFQIELLIDKFAGYNSGIHSLDPQTMICSFGSPNQALFGIASAQMARFYGLTPRSNSALSDSIYPDFQSGYEKAATGIFSALAGCAHIGCQGIVGADQGFSFEQLVIDNEWLDAYNYILSGFEVNEETLAFDLIETVGVGGNYFAQEHSAMHVFDSFWHSKIFSRNGWDKWMELGNKDTLTVASEIVEELLADYQKVMPVIGNDEERAIDKLISKAKNELGKS